MGTKTKQFTDATKRKLASMEKRLSGALRPVKPRKEFVHNVAHRIQSTPRVTLVDRIADWHLVAVLIAGIVSLAVFLAVLARALMNLLWKKRAA